MEKPPIYLDNAASTRVHPEVSKMILQYMDEYYGNPHALHGAGVKAAEGMVWATEHVANVIHAEEHEILFTSGGTESNNLVLQGVSRTLKSKGNHIITSAIEHAAVLEVCKYLEENEQIEVTILDVDEEGLVDLEDLKSAIKETTILVSIMTANNEIGTIEPIKEIAEICEDHKILFHTDAVQAFGKIPIDVREIPIDFLSFSSHKFHGPKGIGGLYLRDFAYFGKENPLIQPILFGGGQERGLRSGTANVPGIVGMGKACELILKDPEEPVRQQQLRDQLINYILEEIPGAFLNGSQTARLPNNVNFGVEGLNGESMLHLLASNGIYCSTGSACSAHSKDYSHVLQAIGLKPPKINGCLRFSLSRFTTQEEIERTQTMLTEVVSSLRKIAKL